MINKTGMFILLGMVSVLYGCASTPYPPLDDYNPYVLPPKKKVEQSPIPYFNSREDRYLFEEKLQPIAPAPPAREGVKLIVDIGTQNFHYYENGVHVYSGPISSGKYSGSTPRGSFRAGIKSRWHISSLYPEPNGGAPMHYAIQVSGDVFLHEGYLPGYPASHGCIRLWTEDARFLWKKIRSGDKIVVI